MPTDSDQEARERLLLTVNSIPPGRVSSFGRIAEAAGFPGRARWVGRVLSQLPANTSIPWHRVLGHNGTITCPRNDLASNRLTKEGVAVHDCKVDMRKYVWPD
ncbi:MAG: MGMT family protein [Pseudomonadota bacterium]|nr:MGMT family protein [Pseudomonadota bacterium]